MFYKNNDYLVPIIIGCSKESIKLANKLMAIKGSRAHIFFDEFSLFCKIRFRCHKVYPLSDEWILESLKSFCHSLEEYYMPTLFVCDDFSRKFIDKHRELLEPAFVIVESSDFFD